MTTTIRWTAAGCGLSAAARNGDGRKVTGGWGHGRTAFLGLAVTLVLAPAVGRCQEPGGAAKPAAQADELAAAAKPAPPPMLPAEKGWLRLTKDDAWVDMKNKQVIVGGRVCLREGALEMFACPKNTKEHESIVSVTTPARFVHGALLALGAQAGPPVQFDPVYKPAQGTEIGVEVLWRDREGKEHRVKAQEWIKEVKTGDVMKHPWVFAGSGFWSDEAGKERFYYADGGEFICVSNFSTAMLDLPIQSSAANDTLLFCAFTERIPPIGTPVQLFLIPKLDKPSETATPGAKEAAKSAAKDEAAAKAEPAGGQEQKPPASEPTEQPAAPAKSDKAG
jgi:hypothetical protein